MLLFVLILFVLFNMFMNDLIKNKIFNPSCNTGTWVGTMIVCTFIFCVIALKVFMHTL